MLKLSFCETLFLRQRILRNVAFCENNLWQKWANLVACDAEQCGILRKIYSASYAQMMCKSLQSKIFHEKIRHSTKTLETQENIRLKGSIHEFENKIKYD